MDTFTRQERSEIMRRVKSKDTTPERLVQSLLHRLGYRFRLHAAALPGKPDIVLPGRKTVVFVHGCFWHRHAGCRRASTPTTRTEYWMPKFERTVARDRRNRRLLKKMGWTVIVIWECEVGKPDALSRKLKNRIGLRMQDNG